MRKRLVTIIAAGVVLAAAAVQHSDYAAHTYHATDLVSGQTYSGIVVGDCYHADAGIDISGGQLRPFVNEC